MVNVLVHNLQFHAYHGVHDEEKVLGNTYTVDCEISFQERVPVIEYIDDTINYVKVYNIIKERMNTPSVLLETVVMEIGHSIQAEFPEIKSISITLKKLHPPLEGMVGSTGVNWFKDF